MRNNSVPTPTMNLTVKLKDLRYIVDLVSTVTPTRSTLPSLSNVLLAYDDCVLTACASDLRSFARAHCEAVGEQSGAFGVRADLLGCFLGGCTAEDVEITTDKRATFKCGKKETTLAITVPEEFKVHPDVEGNCVMLGAKELHDAIGRVIHAAAEEKDGKPERVSVAFDFNGTLDVLALNGRQIDVVKLEAQGSGIHLVPTFLAELFRKSLRDHEGEVALTISENMAKLESSKWSVSGPLLNGNYPKWRECLPFLNESMPGRKFNRVQLVDAVRMCLPYAEMGWARVHLKGDGEAATVETIGQDDTRSVVEMTGDPIDVFFQGKEMLGLLNALSDDTVTLEYKDEKGVGIVVHENNFTAAIMPLEK